MSLIGLITPELWKKRTSAIPDTGNRVGFLLLMIALMPFMVACEKNGSPIDAASVSLKTTPPNIVLIVADDLGFSDLGVFGSEIETPHIDALARSGLVLTNYYSAPVCAATRAELMSGTDHHRAGQGLMLVNIDGTPGYEGRLNDRVFTIADRLQQIGYHTYMTGKWHLGRDSSQSPHARGFDRSFALLDGGASHFDDQTGPRSHKKATYTEDGKTVDKLPNGFYSTDFYTDKLIGYLREQKDDSPFFAYLAYTAPHWPLHAPDEEIEAQRGRYAGGYDELRQRRFAAFKRAGYVQEHAEPPQLPDDFRTWKELTADERAYNERIMEVYAAMISRMDQQIGRLISYLKERRQLENTLIIFQSDNGPEARSAIPEFGHGADNRLENVGRPGSFALPGKGWGAASSAAYYRHKNHTTEGGIRVPSIIGGGAVQATPGRSDALIVSYDIAPTILELASGEENSIRRDSFLSMSGTSFADLIRGDHKYLPRSGDEAIGRAHAGHGAIRQGDWKLLWVGDVDFFKGLPTSKSEPGPMSGAPMPRSRFDRGSPEGVPIGPGGPWRLHNLADDPGETHDVSVDHPAIFSALLDKWDQYVADYGVLVKSGSN